MRSGYWLGICGIVFAGILGVISASWLSPAPPPEIPPSGSPVEPLPQPYVNLDQIVELLAADDTRAQGLAQLQNVPYQKIARLRTLERDTPPRVKADLEQHVVALQEALAANPPPLSIDVKDAPLADIAAVLSEATGAAIVYDPVPLFTPQTFTLQANNKPFWDILGSLADQHPITFFTIRDPFDLWEDAHGLSCRAIDGPCCLFAYTYNNLPVPGQRTPAAPTTRPLKWTFRFSLGIDPRLWVIDAPVKTTVGTDDAGNTIVPADAPFAPHPEILDGNTFYAESDMAIPAHPGKKINSVKIEGKVILAASDLQTIVKFDQPADCTFQLGDVTFDVKCYPREQIPRTDYVITAKSPTGDAPRARMRILDNPNVRVSSPPLRRLNVSYQFNLPTLKPAPFLLEVRIPRKIIERPIAFEIKDIPLPPAP